MKEQNKINLDYENNIYNIECVSYTDKSYRDKEKDYITKYLRIRGYYFDTVAVCLKKIPITDKEQRDKLIKIITSFDYQLISTDSLEKIHDLLMEIDRTEIVR